MGYEADDAANENATYWLPIAKIPRKPYNQPHARIAAPQTLKYRTARGSAKLLKNNDACTGMIKKAAAYRIAITAATVR
jgi:hypothetical protein